ncbi:MULTISPECIES: NAD-dependent epimerase/dehydratase family protein [unclassified Spirosoma]|uniref:NAD-dependent epimerase/dehydratase family protein n=1 Tax=unclassified Spirosoma TaxID=2621999 RepID=UPI00096548A4|nr:MULTISPECIES: NAD-dependent epimerase/dehydratase family protein [unclassified Spirosoma]MBN8823740.1 NAD-dependent epimerase/dehydratase family protein [Spirosoma sp.]OJW76714.1 MAG: epimerase [Spirosoma sp. 48-14]
MTSSLRNPVFVTGATGFIGSHIVRRYLADGHPVSVLYRPSSGYGMLADVADQLTWLEGDVLDIPSLEAAILSGSESGDLDVIHAAAIVSFVPKDRDQMERINVEGTANVVNVCLKAGVRKLGYISSVAAIGRPITHSDESQTPFQINESQKWEDSPNNSVYAKTKYRAELEVWRGVAEGLNAVMVNPSIVLGVGEWSRSSLQLIKYVYDEKPFYPAGLVNYVDVLDVADSLVQLMQSDITAERFILNAGTISYRSLLEQIAAVLGKRPPRLRVPTALTRVLWPLEAVRAWLTGKNPLITRETARSASSHYQYDGRKIEQVLRFQYRPLSDTLKRVATAFNTLPASR